MINAIVLLRVRRDCISRVADALAEQPGITEVYTVAGQYDLVAIVRAAGDEQIAEMVTGTLLDIEGLLSSETLLAFQTRSNFNLAELFGI